jgi:hypothetical protein
METLAITTHIKRVPVRASARSSPGEGVHHRRIVAPSWSSVHADDFIFAQLTVIIVSARLSPRGRWRASFCFCETWYAQEQSPGTIRPAGVTRLVLPAVSAGLCQRCG